MESSFAYVLLQWIRDHKKQLSQGYPDHRATGLTEGLTQALFAFDRAYRGLAGALRDPALPAIEGYKLRGTPSLGQDLLTTEQRNALGYALDTLAQAMRDPANASSALGQEILALPAPNKVLASASEHRLLEGNCRAFLHKNAPSHWTSSRVQCRREGGWWLLDLEVFMEILSKRKPFGKQQSAFEADDTAVTFGQWLAATTKLWRCMQEQIREWVIDPRLIPDSKVVMREQIALLRERLRAQFSVEELALIREHHARILGAM